MPYFTLSSGVSLFYEHHLPHALVNEHGYSAGAGHPTGVKRKYPQDDEEQETQEVETNTSREKILFIMGLLTDGEAWKLQTEYFKMFPDCESVSYNNRGVPPSGAPWSGYSTSTMAADALELADHLGWKNFHIVGVSMGGMIALELALLMIEKKNREKDIRSLTLICTHAGGPTATAPLIGIKQIFVSIFSKDMESKLDNAMQMLYGTNTLSNPDRLHHFREHHRQRYSKREKPQFQAVAGHMFAVSSHFVSYPRLLKLRFAHFPIVVIVGTEDKLVREYNSYLLARTVGAKLLVLENAGHGLPGECAEEINSEIRKLIDLALLKEKERTLLSESEIKLEQDAISSDRGAVKEAEREGLTKFSREIKALSLTCKHHYHCTLHHVLTFIRSGIAGFIAGFFLPSPASLFGNQPATQQTNRLDNALQFALLFGSAKVLLKSLICVWKAFRSYLYVRRHNLVVPRHVDEHEKEHRENLRNQESNSSVGFGPLSSVQNKSGFVEGFHQFHMPWLQIASVLASASLLFNTTFAWK